MNYSSILFTLSFIFCTALKATTYIACPVYCDPKGQESFFPNANTPYKSSSKQFQKIYWECATVMFATSKRHNPNAVHLLMSNRAQAPEPFNSILTQLGVQIVQCPFTYQPPEGWYYKFRNALFTLDCLEHLASISQESDHVILLDADTIWKESANTLLKQIDKDGLVTYHMDYNETNDLNGVTRKDYQDLFEAYYTNPTKKIPTHVGGELIAANKTWIDKITAEFPAMWRWMLQRFTESKTPIFNTEEHYLSLICWHLGHTTHSGNDIIKRIWTNEKIHRNVTGNELDYCIWHLPGEKQRGFRKLFEMLKNEPETFFGTPLGTQFTLMCAQLCSII